MTLREDRLGNPPLYCDHKPPKVATIRTDGGVRVECLSCGAVSPERDRPGEAFAALLRIPYRANRSDISRDCVTANRRMKGARGALTARATAGFRPLL